MINKVILTLCALAFIIALYFAFIYIDPIRQIIFPEEINNQEFNKVVQNTDTSSSSESSSKKTIIDSVASLLERPQSSIYSKLHKMINTKIVADQLWGETEITEERVNALIKEITSSNYSDKDMLLAMLNNWKAGDFSNAVKEHNYLWDQLGGTVGEAYGLR